MKGLELELDNERARLGLLRAGLLDGFNLHPSTDAPEVRTLINSGPARHYLGIRFTGFKDRRENGFALLSAPRAALSIEEFSKLASEIVTQLARPGTLKPRVFNLNSTGN